MVVFELGTRKPSHHPIGGTRDKQNPKFCGLDLIIEMMRYATCRVEKSRGVSHGRRDKGVTWQKAVGKDPKF